MRMRAAQGLNSGMQQSRELRDALYLLMSKGLDAL
jgi:hypothetical protein